MKILVETSCGQKWELNVPNEENGFWYKVAQLLPDMEFPCAVNIEDQKTGKVLYELDVLQRGTYTENGETLPSMYVTMTYDDAGLFLKKPYKEVYLTCIHPESNNYKFYHLIPTMYDVDAEYGRIGGAGSGYSRHSYCFGTKHLQTPYPTKMYWIRYFEKLSKGYIDQSDIYLGDKVKAETPIASDEDSCSDLQVPQTVSNALFEQLLRYAKNLVKDTLVSTEVTVEQAEAAKKTLTALRHRKTVDAFNRQVLKLMQISPRQCDDVRRMLARSTNDFATIVAREEDLCNAMSVIANENAKKQAEQENSGVEKQPAIEDRFTQYGATVCEASDDERSFVISQMRPEQKPLVKRIYKIDCKEQSNRFDKYCKNRNIQETKFLWHGSRNCNWLSIIKNGLMLNPNAQINGKMFGHGIYFAISSQKSFGYTDYYGSHWARGTSQTGFMALYETAIGKSYHWRTWSDGNPGTVEGYVKHGDCDSLWAHAGTALYNDEIVFYSESAMAPRYLVEFGD